jgi:DNA-binding transcriptional MocR family regulator
MDKADWIPALEAFPGPKYLSIARALAHDVAQGRLRPGDRLPPQRELAQGLGVDLTTVTRAYGEARSLGIIDADGRRGSFVRAPAAPAIRTEVPAFDTGMNLPPLPQRSTLAERYADQLAEVLAGPAAGMRLQYQPSGGAPEDRRAGAAWLAGRGIAADEDNVLVVSGGQTALHAIATAELRAGDAVCTGPLVYPGWLASARRLDLRTTALEADAEGILPEALERAAPEAKALYVVPTNDNPTTATMGVERRRAIAGIARRHGLKIIEDDAYGRLPAVHLPALASLAPELTWHVASLSKIVSPMLRIAYLRAPSLRDALRLAADVHETTVMAPPLNAAVATHWLESGAWAELVAEVRAECMARQAIAAQILPRGSYRAHPEGYHLWLPLDSAHSPADLVSALAPSGLSAVPGHAFTPDRGESSGIRVSIGGNLSRERLARALSLLDALLHQKDRPARVLV